MHEHINKNYIFFRSLVSKLAEKSFLKTFSILVEYAKLI